MQTKKILHTKLRVQVLALFMLTLSCLACSPTSSTFDDEEYDKFCTLIAGYNSLSVKIQGDFNSDHYYSYKINSESDNMDYDECNDTDTHNARQAHLSLRPLSLTNKIFIEDSFMTFNLPWSLLDQYIEDEIIINNTIDVKVYSRKSCDDQNEQIISQTATVEWEAYEINGPGCGVNYTGRVQF